MPTDAVIQVGPATATTVPVCAYGSECKLSARDPAWPDVYTCTVDSNPIARAQTHNCLITTH